MEKTEKREERETQGEDGQCSERGMGGTACGLIGHCIISRKGYILSKKDFALCLNRMLCIFIQMKQRN